MQRRARTMWTARHPAEPAIALLSDQRLFREGLIQLLRRSGFHRVAEFGTARSLKTAAVMHAPDVVIVDLDHEHEDTATLVRTLRHDIPHAHLVAVGAALRQAAAVAPAGAVETPGASVRDLAEATVGRPRAPTVALIGERRRWEQVTPRQRDVLRWLAVGLDNQAIARKLRIGDRAVKTHVTKLLDMFAVENRTQLALLAYRAGLQPPRRR